MGELLSDDDSVFRMVVHPVAFKGKSFSRGKMINLTTLSEREIETSLVWEKFLASEADLHSSGCDLASRMNERTRIEKGEVKPKNRKIYCGAYQLPVAALGNLRLEAELPEIETTEVRHAPEDGQEAHVSLRVTLKHDYEGDVEGTKTAIADRIWASLHGPLRHICTCDDAINPHPSGDLEDCPLGSYSFPSLRSSS
ncbi:hypothetical protein [Occallatibacter savannae]|uniref:hypothetical protein n=1 Tax=Occallatibacter savannae TaxID=1002691 RepID=UPI000D692A72|nr:hypothetical protein [Occallatibacter savannae]